MTENKNTIRFKCIFNMIPIILLTLYYYTHYIEGTYSFFFPLGLSMLWLTHSLTTSNLSDILFNSEAKWWMAYACTALFMVLLGFSSTNINFFISRLPYYIIPPMGYFVIRHYRIREMLVLLCAIAIIFFVNLLYNINLWSILPDIFEEQESTEFSIEYSVMMNLATTSYIAVCLWTIGMLLMVVENIQSKIARLLLIVIMFATGFFMFFVNTRGTATMLFIVEIVGFIMAKFEPKRLNVRSYYIGASLIIVFVGSFVVLPILMWMIQNTESSRLTERLEDIMSFTSSRGNVNSLSEGSMAQRIALSQTSLTTFFSSPLATLIGIGDHTVSLGMDLHKSGIGGHSEFIDVLARYGILGAFVFVNILKSYYKVLKSLTSQRKIMKYLNVVFFIFILYGFLNNVFQPITQVFMFVVLPMVTVLINNKSAINGK